MYSTAGMWGNGRCSVVCPVFLVKSLLLFSCHPHSGPNIAPFLTCKMKGNRGQYGQGNESFLIPLTWSHSTGFLLCHGYVQGRWESALLLALSQALGTYFPAAWKFTGSLSPSSGGGSNGNIPRCHFAACSMWAMFPWNEGTKLPFLAPRAPRAWLAGCITVFMASCTVQLPNLLVFFCILCWRGLWSDKTMDRACTNTCVWKVHAWADGKLSGKEKLLG